MNFNQITPSLSGNIATDVKALLIANGKPKTFNHVKAVADMNIKIAEQYGLDVDICEKCSYLHDISAVAAPDDMMAYAAKNGWYIDEAEQKYPFLLHQRISKVIAEQNFKITDDKILSAIECHSTLKANPSAYDMALFVADKLAWDGEGSPPFYTVISDALKKSLEAASLAYMDYIVEHNMILHPHKWFEESLLSLRNKCKEVRTMERPNSDFWTALERLVSESKIIIDRPKGSCHPKYPNYIYPVNYGYLENTSSMDGGGIDVWKGTNGDYIDAIICSVDLIKRDSEIKILIGCNEEEKQLAIPNNEYMNFILIRRNT